MRSSIYEIIKSGPVISKIQNNYGLKDGFKFRPLQDS